MISTPAYRRALAEYDRQYAVRAAEEAAWREKTDRPLYMFEADRQLFTIYGQVITPEYLEDIAKEPSHALLRLPDGFVSPRGARYLLSRVESLRRFAA